ncbi:hypothetical protein PENTCL1PPCAC_19355 [Pristionchus entomophagus]|uniref:ShK domain-containing protein n=1 Tax=Pristionchus entomophagus TaxID=358040 RepID=A0AAV5TRR4_9BILA|nr:hypothetical protein PENTCL1PPCAC_19355 [Pristionchus entomophagus]
MTTSLLPLLVLAAISQQTVAQCGGQDHAACPRFMSNGFCTNTSRSLELRQKVCGRGCGLCLADCHDNSRLCIAYARTGFCENDKFAIETKRSMCMKTCFCDKRTTTTLPPGAEIIEESLMKITDTDDSLGPAPVPVVPGAGPEPAVGPVPVPIIAPLLPDEGPQPVAVITDGEGENPIIAGPAPVPVVQGPVPVTLPLIFGPGGSPQPVPDLTGSDQFPAPVPVVVPVVPVRPPTRVLGGGSSSAAPDVDMLQPEGDTATTKQPRRPFTTCGLLKDDANSEVFVVHEGVSLDLARHPFNDRATSIMLLPDCEMDLWEHVGQAGNMLRFHSSSEHTFKLDGPYRRAISSVACRCN